MTAGAGRAGRIALVGAYLAAYVLLFALLEGRDVQVAVVHTRVDDLIPFCRWFVIPYLMWFAYLAATAAYFLLRCGDEGEVRRLLATYGTGMTLFLVVSAAFPNGHDLRPDLSGDDWLTGLVGFVYAVDTPTNILPSMHVFATVASTTAFLRQEEVRGVRGLVPAIWLCCVSIVLSTMFLKQHSVVDVGLALLLNWACRAAFYPASPRPRAALALSGWRS